MSQEKNGKDVLAPLDVSACRLWADHAYERFKLDYADGRTVYRMNMDIPGGSVRGMVLRLCDEIESLRERQSEQKRPRSANRVTRRWFIRVEWKPQDCWVGVFWKRNPQVWPGFGHMGLDVWVCIIPMLPIHFGYEPSIRNDR